VALWVIAAPARGAAAKKGCFNQFFGRGVGLFCHLNLGG